MRMVTDGFVLKRCERVKAFNFASVDDELKGFSHFGSLELKVIKLEYKSIGRIS